jgi:hypothetical protein
MPTRRAFLLTLVALALWRPGEEPFVLECGRSS